MSDTDRVDDSADGEEVMEASCAVRKRSRTINLARMRKSPPRFAVRPMALAVATAGLVGCGPSAREAQVYESVEDCIDEHPGSAAHCRAAYDKAKRKLQEEGNRYSSRERCEQDFGEEQCVQRGSWFNPMLAAFMFSPRYIGAGYPLYHSRVATSPYYGKWTTIDGESYTKKPGTNKVVLTNKTISRGGFGSTTAAKSKWGGRSSRGGWGG